jgi:diguanylate cyclase (GGDEF)-like protein/PAS domain S-box-containing protein
MKAKTSLQLAWAVVVFLALSLFGWVGWDLFQSRAHELAAAEQVATTLTKLIEGHAQARVQKIDLRLFEFVERYQHAVADRAPRAEIDAALARNLGQFPEAHSFRVADENGHYLYDASGSLSKTTIGDRPYFQTLKSQPGAGLVVSPPLYSRVTKEWVFVLARRLDDRNGHFAGVVLTAVRADFFESFYSTLGLAEKDVIVFWSNDLELFARWPRQEAWRGKKHTDSPLLSQLAGGATAGSFRSINDLDGEKRLHAYRALKELPYVVSVGLSEDALLSEWRHRLAIYALLGVVLLIALSAFAWSWTRSYRQTAALARKMTRAFNEKTRESRALLDAISDPAWLVDTEGRFLAVNEALCRIARKSMEQILGTTAKELWTPDVAKKLLESQAAVYRERRPMREEQWFDIGNGPQPFEILRTPVYDEQGEPRGLAGVAWDMSERYVAEERRRLITHVFDHSNEAVLIMNIEGKIIALNKSFSAITGYAIEEAKGHLPTLIAAQRHDTNFFESIARGLATQNVWRGEAWLKRKNGEDCPVFCNVSLIKDEQGGTVNLIAFITDISERKDAEARIESLANIDQMTLLPNRQGFSRELDDWLAMGANGALLVFDLDQLGRINDAFGHLAGDKLLGTICIRLRALLSQDDLFGRLEGGQFAVLLKQTPERSVVEATTQALIDTIAQPVEIHGSDVVCKACAGICLIPEDGAESATLLRNAGAAMHNAKTGGQSAYRFYAPNMSAGVAERLRLESDLRWALQRNELVLHYQPQVDIASGRIIGFESLLRWRHPELGMLMPDSFIPLAEESRLILPIGTWVLEEACRQNRAWQDEGLPPLVVAVNLSAVQFHEHDIVAIVTRSLAASSLEPRWLELEITEGVVMHEPERVIRVLQELRDLGVKLSIDDFGTGYSSLSYLKRFPIDKIKIDKSFVRDLDRSAGDAAIVRMVIAIASELEHTVIAEGVETEEQLEFLRQHHCVEYQGYLCSQAVPASEVRRLLDLDT